MTIRDMTRSDAESVLAMMRVFYASPAVRTNGSEEIFRSNIENCIGASPYAQGYVFCEGETTIGYAMIAKSYSTEFGKPCVWIEDLYIMPEHRLGGIGGRFLTFIEEKYPESLFRLEVEAENTHAMHVYEKYGYEALGYVEMIKGCARGGGLDA